jgi:hypothetical protein
VGSLPGAYDSSMFQQIENYVDECLQDRYARRCGLPSGIGRNCLLDDHVLARVIEKITLPQGACVLDLGREPGFLRRWLRWSSVGPCKTHVESLLELRAIRPGTCGYDRIIAIEPSYEGDLSEPLARCIGGNLAPDGRYGVTLVSNDGGHEAKLLDATDYLERHTRDVELTDLSAQIRHYAETLYTAFLLGDWDKLLRTHVLDQAARVLGAIESGRFNYTLITGSARAD